MQAAANVLTLKISDWDHTRTVKMKVPTDASVSEVVEEARLELGLPGEVSYSALFRDRQLPGMETLRDAGVSEDSDFEIMPEVEAGGGLTTSPNGEAGGGLTTSPDGEAGGGEGV